MEKELFDIGEVCKLLGTTSRTLRFYESKGIISSFASPFKSRRQYSVEQIEHIKRILVLRSLGLSIAQIQEIQNRNTNLRTAIAEHKAKLKASIVSKYKELRLLDEALLTIEGGGSIFEPQTDLDNHEANLIEISNDFTDIFISGKYNLCFPYFTKTLQNYMPLNVFELAIKDTLDPIGNFVQKDKIECDKEHRDIVYSFLKYEKLGIRIKLVFYNEMIHGIWFDYYN